MNPYEPIDILLVEDNYTDAELALRVLKKDSLANNLKWVRNGQEALDFMFAKGGYSNRTQEKPPKVVLLDLRLPLVDGLEVLKRAKTVTMKKDSLAAQQKRRRSQVNPVSYSES